MADFITATYPELPNLPPHVHGEWKVREVDLNNPDVRRRFATFMSQPAVVSIV